MKVWSLRPLDEALGPWVPWEDKCFGFVIAAEDEATARAMAAGDPGDEGADAWFDPTMSSCIDISSNPPAEATVIMRDYAS